MSPIKFQECNAVFAKDQPQYRQLPAYRGSDGRVISCWGLSWRERMRAFLSGRVWLSLQTFNQPLQPSRLDVGKPEL